MLDRLPAYTIKYSKRLRGGGYRLNIRNGKLTITSSKKLSESEAEKILHQHADWINLHASKITSTIDEFAPRQISLCGETYEIKFDTAHDFLIGENRRLLVHKSQSGMKVLQAWLIRRAKTFLTEMLLQSAAQVELKVTKIQIREQSTRWGSCSTSGAISLNWRLALAPIEVAQYVVWHELAHILHPNHSADFWRQVSNWDPNYRVHRRWLKENSARLYEV